MPEYRGSGMWASARAVVSVKRVRIVASGNFPVIGLRLVVPLKSEASRFIQSGAGSGVETTRPCAVPRRSCSGGGLIQYHCVRSSIRTQVPIS